VKNYLLKSSNLSDVTEARFSIEYQLQFNKMGVKNPALLKSFIRALKKVGLTEEESLQVLNGAPFTVEKIPSELKLMIITIPKYFKHFIDRETNLIKKFLIVDVQPSTATHLLNGFVDKINDIIIGAKMKSEDKVKFKEHFYESTLEYKDV